LWLKKCGNTIDKGGSEPTQISLFMRKYPSQTKLIHRTIKSDNTESLPKPSSIQTICTG
jgi:hypothetical protein